jgi:hypothetical protein
MSTLAKIDFRVWVVRCGLERQWKGRVSAASDPISAANAVAGAAVPAPAGREVDAGDETGFSSRKSSEEIRQIGRVFFESPGTRGNGG